MKIKEFTYTKSTGAVSQRVILELQSPSKLVSGIDITELSQEDQAQFASTYARIRQVFDEAFMGLQKKYDVVNNYRNFIPEQMTNITTENI